MATGSSVEIAPGHTGRVDWQTSDLQLLLLAYAGSRAPTYLPVRRSPVIDRGEGLSCVDLDNGQCGVGRPANGNDNTVATCYIGAVELVSGMDDVIGSLIFID